MKSQNQELLAKMNTFYSNRYKSNPKEKEKRFNAAVEDLIETGDITKKDYIAFCMDNDIEPTIKEKPKTSSYGGGGGCGSSTTSSRGGC